MDGVPSIHLRFNRDGTCTGDPGEPQVRSNHVHDLERIQKDLSSWRVDAKNLSRTNVVVALLVFLFRSLRNWIWTLLLAPATIFTDPLGTLTSAAVFPVVNIGVALCCLVFWIGGKIGLGRLIDLIGATYADGYSMPNWPSQDLFGSEMVQSSLQAARPFLTGDVQTTEPQTVSTQDDNPDFTRLATNRIFSVPLARVFLAMSAIVYERKDALVNEAADIIYQASKRYSKGSHQYGVEIQKAEAKLVQSEETIKLFAAKMGLAFDGVTDLASVTGPFASIFYTPPATNQKPFIVLCFKGTTPVQYAEWLVDASISKTGASVWYGPGSGAAHEGFYTDLFGRPGADGSNGYGSIIRTLKHVAQRMKVGGGGHLAADERIPVWVCGHSLGAALASLCYARFLHSEQDLGDDLHLRDCYTFGTPRIGNGDFASAFEGSLVSPIDRGVILWRVINHLDIVCRVPPGLGDDETLRSNLSALSVLNYAHLGPSITLRPARIPWNAPYYGLGSLGAFHETTEVKVVGGRTGDISQDQAIHGYVDSRGNNPLRWLMSFIPSPLYDHFPASYDEHLSNAVSSTSDRFSSGGSAALDLVRSTRTYASDQMSSARTGIEHQVQDVKNQGQRVIGAAQDMGHAAAQGGYELAKDIGRDIKKDIQKRT